MAGAAMAGIRTAAWFYPVHPLPGRVHVFASLTRALGKWGGCGFPKLIRCDLDSPGPIVGWLALQEIAGNQTLLQTTPSAAVRLAVEASRQGIHFRNLVVVAIGEPMAESRKRCIEDSGARVMVAYGTVETPSTATASCSPDAEDDLHLWGHRYAVTSRGAHTANRFQPGDALLVTTIDSFAPKVAINLEAGDSAKLGTRDCGCPLASLGLRSHIREIRSFEKLTGEGVTFARADLESLVEVRLPALFGGTVLDYQMEEESAGGLTRLVVRASPTLGSINEAALRATVLGSLARAGAAAAYGAAIWRDAGTIEVRREVPRATHAGEVLPLMVANGRQRVPRACTDHTPVG